MATASLSSESLRLWTVEAYLHTAFEPDCDFLDGMIEERNVGEYDHASVQKMLMRVFLKNEARWGVNVIQECRLQISESRFRVPDTMVLLASQRVHRIVREVPLICIEVISPEDTWKRVNGVLADYLAMGVKHIWALDPEERKAYRFDAEGLHPVMGGELVAEGSEVRLVVDEMFPATV